MVEIGARRVDRPGRSAEVDHRRAGVWADPPRLLWARRHRADGTDADLLLAASIRQASAALP
jgi:hypothetical protein